MPHSFPFCLHIYFLTILQLILLHSNDSIPSSKKQNQQHKTNCIRGCESVPFYVQISLECPHEDKLV